MVRKLISYVCYLVPILQLHRLVLLPPPFQAHLLPLPEPPVKLSLLPWRQHHPQSSRQPTQLKPSEPSCSKNEPDIPAFPSSLKNVSFQADLENLRAQNSQLASDLRTPPFLSPPHLSVQPTVPPPVFSSRPAYVPPGSVFTSISSVPQASAIVSQPLLQATTTPRTMDELRSMTNLASQVDQQLNSLGFHQSASSSSDDSFSDNDLHRRNSKSSRKKQRKRRTKKSGKDTSLTSYVCNPQLWPHSQLSLHYVSKDKLYESLTLPEFCAGYATILQNPKIPPTELSHRVSHFKDLMYLATQYRWSNVLNFHAACLLEIERGNLQWGNSFHHLTLSTLANGFLHDSNSSHQSFSPPKSPPTLFCSDFQRGQCNYSGDHFGTIKGQKRFVSHICAHCWIKLRSQQHHQESACPNKIVSTS